MEMILNMPLVFQLCSTLLFLNTLAHATGNYHVVGRDYHESVSTSCHQACTELSLQFGDAFHYPDNDSFIIWDAKQQEVRPACRVEPASSTDVGMIMQVLVENWCQFSVKGGGHSRYPDDSNSVGGVTVDLNRMNAVELSADSTRARIGGGAVTYQVYSALDPKNLSYVGGRVDGVGVGGFTLGGGTSPLSAEYGWALDNVFEYEVVLPNSTMVTASENQNPDLYYALRGGGNNFGIVTSFLVRVFPQGPVYTGIRTYNDNITDKFLGEAYKIFAAEDNDTSVGFEYSYQYVQAQDRFIISSTERYARPILNPPVFEDINRIPYESSSSRIDSLGNFSVRSHADLGRVRHIFTTITHFPSQTLSKRAIEIYQEEVQPVKDVEGIAAFLITYSIPANAIRAMRERGGNTLGLDTEGHLIINLLSTAWNNAADDERMSSFANRFIERFEAAALELGSYHPFLYMNYANRDQDVFSGYGKENKQKLVEIQTSIDPLGVFTSHGLWRGFFKLR